MAPQLGISIIPPKNKPLFKIYRFMVYPRETFTLLEPHMQKRNLNFQINGDKNAEKIVLRLFLNESMQVYKSRYYFQQDLDQEIAWYLVMALILKLKTQYSFKPEHILKEYIWK